MVINYTTFYTGAILYNDRVLTIDPKDVAALDDKGLTLEKLGNYTGTILYYDKALIVCTGIVAAVIMSIILVMNTGFTKQAQGMSMNMNMSMKGPGKMSNMSAPMCTTKTVPVSGVPINKTYTIPKGFIGNPTTANGKCVVDNNMESPCTISNGIAIAGHCESVTKAYQVTENGPANLPTEEWFHLAGVTLKPGEFLDLADTTPFVTTKGHMAMVLPCDSSGQPLARLYEGIIDAGVNTLEQLI